ncbi:MAG TPA: hemolysin family protein [Candidatus Eremiobacteraeota bacterium]|nr:MAG: Magnesium and cobalt efflux protein CorC [bacterium ADurb.Bin363]HPZ07078.1 hemolysin family protein [Candidatus Eremiobacteraeota bacterium]
MEDPLSREMFLFLLAEVEASYTKSAITINIIITVILVILGGVFSGANLALTSSNKVRVRELIDKNLKGSQLLYKLIDNRNLTLTTLLIAYISIILLTANMMQIIIGKFAFSGYKLVLITTLITIIMVLLVGEVIFKTIVMYNMDRFSLFIAFPVQIMIFLLYPFSWILIKVSNFAGKLLGINLESQKEFITQDQICLLVEEGEEQGVFEEQEKEMIHSIFSFGDTIAREIMVPRISMICIEVTQTIYDVLNAILETGYSRIPIYEEIIDNIVGIVYEKDMLKILKEEKLDIFIKDVMRPAYFTPEIKKIDELLKEMQQKRISMAIVVDEYGGIDGLITIEDIIEEIVGEIEDEYDQKSAIIEQLDNNVFIVDARVNIEDVNKYFDINLPVDECETIGGFVYSLLGKIPTQGEEVRVNSLSIMVEKIHRHMIKKLKIKKLDEDSLNKDYTNLSGQE